MSSFVTWLSGPFLVHAPILFTFKNPDDASDAKTELLSSIMNLQEPLDAKMMRSQVDLIPSESGSFNLNPW